MADILNAGTITELQGSPTVSMEGSNFVATCKWLCAWDEAVALADEILFGSPAIPEPPSPATGPLEYPYETGRFAFASTVKIEPYKAKTNPHATITELASYEKAILLITFSTPTFTTPIRVNPDDTFNTRESFEPSIEAISLPIDDFKWKTGDQTDLKEEEAPVKQLFGGVYVIQHTDVPNPIPEAYTAYDNMIAIQGKVNNLLVNAKIFTHQQFAIGTLLAHPPLGNKDSNGFTFTYRFSHRPTGWNKYWRSDIDAFDEIIRRSDDSVVRNYPLATFNI